MNIINAIIELVENPIDEIKNHYESNNRVNHTGNALEEYVKDLFCGTVYETNENARLERMSEVFSYLGNATNPPDVILRGGDAIEIKKLESDNPALALNSSYPKHKLLASNPLINQACRNCEEWTEKDIIYAVGVMKATSLRSLIFVYGEDYAADIEIYSKIKKTIKTSVESIQGVEFSETRELGRINRVDPLGITYLRVRGMWHIENPWVVFNYIYQRDNSRDFNFACIINNEKWHKLTNIKDLLELSSKKDNLAITDVRIKDTNNPAILKDAKLITFYRQYCKT